MQQEVCSRYGRIRMGEILGDREKKQFDMVLLWGCTICSLFFASVSCKESRRNGAVVCSTYLSSYRGVSGKSIWLVSGLGGGDTSVCDNISFNGMFLSDDISFGDKKGGKGGDYTFLFRCVACGVSFILPLYVELRNQLSEIVLYRAGKN